MKKYAVILLGCLLLFGCKQEVLEPEQQISGSFALDGGSGLTTQYLEFDKGYLTVVQLDRPRVFAENKIWNLSTSQSETEMIYTISGQRLEDFIGAVRDLISKGFSYKQLAYDIKSDYARPEFYNNMFKKWGLATSDNLWIPGKR